MLRPPEPVEVQAPHFSIQQHHNTAEAVSTASAGRTVAGTRLVTPSPSERVAEEHCHLGKALQVTGLAGAVGKVMAVDLLLSTAATAALRAVGAETGLRTQLQAAASGRTAAATAAAAA